MTGDTESLGFAAVNGLLYKPHADERNGTLQWKPKRSEETCPLATLFAVNLTNLPEVLNPGRRVEKPANKQPELRHFIFGTT
jgi:hypothetical protein